MRYRRAVLRGVETVRHEDDTSESALYSNNFVWEATVSSLSYSRIHDLIIGAAPRGPQCVGKVPRWCGGQKPGGEVAYAGKVGEYSRQPINGNS